MSLAFGLRGCVAICLACIGFAIYSEWSDLNLIEARTKEVSGRTIPLLIKVAQMSELQSGFEASLASVQTLDAVPELDQLALRVAALERVFERSIAEVNSSENDTVLFGVEIFGETIAQRKKIVEKIAEIDGGILAGLDILTQLERAILIAQSDPRRSVAGASRGALYSATEMDEAQTLGEMSSSVATLAILTRRFFDDYAVQNTTSLDAKIISEVNILAARVARLNDLDTQRKIAAILVAYRNAVVDRNGVFGQSAALRGLQQSQQERYAQAGDFLKEIDAWANAQVETAAIDFNESVAQTGEIVQRIRIVDVTFNLVLLLTSLGMLWFMIERRIISRLSRLTRHIQDLSRGHLQRKIVLTGQDEITEVEKAVEQSRVNSFALQRSNEELERFAYVAAHDLRAPLRAIANLVEWTEEDFAEDLPREVQKNIALIRGRVDRLSGHLSALLDYARAGQVEAEKGVFNLSDFVADLSKGLHLAENFKLVVEHDAGPFVTYPTPLKTILLNLVANASKHHDRGAGKITLGSKIETGQVLITVSDDGPGIAQVYHDQIFVLFQTLKSRDDVEGSGLGLALVQKLAHTLEGEVTLTSDPARQRGTTFTVRLPLNLAALHSPEFQKGLAA